MAFDYTRVRALVTGGAHGIGKATALALARAGADVVINYAHSADAAKETVAEIQELGRRALSVQADLTDSEQANRMVEEAVSFLGGLDLLFCNAGHLVDRVFISEMSDDHYHKVLEVNLGTTFRTCRAAINELAKSNRPRIVTMSSLAAHNGGGRGSVMYAASKAAVRGFTKGLAKELGPRGITVNTVAPAFIANTAFHNTFSPIEAQQSMIAGAPVGRAGSVDDVALAVLYLGSAEASFITGTTLDIDGGTWPR